MKVKDIERVIFTPGLSRESLTSDYYAIDNTVIVGTTGTGKTTTTQAIVKSILDSNEPDTYSLLYLDMTGHETNPLCNTNRILSSMTLMRYMKESFPFDTYAERAEQVIRMLSIAMWWSSRKVPSYDEGEPERPPKLLVLVIDGFDALDELEQKLVFTMMKACPFVKVIASAQTAKTFKDFLDLFEYKIVTKVHNALDSDIVLGCNLGYKQADKYGSCWFTSESVPGFYRKYGVKMMSTSLLNRYMKTQAGYEGAVNSIVEDVEDFQQNAKQVSEWFRKWLNCQYDSFNVYIEKELLAPRRGGSYEEA